MSEQLELALFAPGATREAEGSGEAMLAEHEDDLPGKKWSDLMERAGGESFEPEDGLEAIASEQGKPWRRWDAGGGTERLVAGALGVCPGGASFRHIQTRSDSSL
jgi:hypothetical protein